jgi:hypothetical protein
MNPESEAVRRELHRLIVRDEMTEHAHEVAQRITTRIQRTLREKRRTQIAAAQERNPETGEELLPVMK